MRNIAKIMLACGAMAVILLILSPAQNALLNNSFSYRFFWLSALILAGGITYIGVILALRVFSLAQIKILLKRGKI